VPSSKQPEKQQAPSRHIARRFGFFAGRPRDEVAGDFDVVGCQAEEVTPVAGASGQAAVAGTGANPAGLHEPDAVRDSTEIGARRRAAATGVGSGCALVADPNGFALPCIRTSG
jgi:hypothetical protein